MPDTLHPHFHGNMHVNIIEIAITAGTMDIRECVEIVENNSEIFLITKKINRIGILPGIMMRFGDLMFLYKFPGLNRQ